MPFRVVKMLFTFNVGSVVESFDIKTFFNI